MSKRREITLLTDKGEQTLYYRPEKIDYKKLKADLPKFRSNFRQKQAILIIRSKENFPLFTISYSHISKIHIFRFITYYTNQDQRDVLTLDRLDYQSTGGQIKKILEAL